jgi:hypothetical protein
MAVWWAPGVEIHSAGTPSGADAFGGDVVVQRHGRQHGFVRHPIVFEAPAGGRGACAYQADDSV